MDKMNRPIGEHELSDSEITMLPGWTEALNELIATYEMDKRRAPDQTQIKYLSEILIERFRYLGYLQFNNKIA